MTSALLMNLQEFEDAVNYAMSSFSENMHEKGLKLSEDLSTMLNDYTKEVVEIK